MSKTLRILLLDDSENDRMMVKDALLQVRADIELVEADEIQTGLGLLARGDLDCALIDHRLPSGDSLTVLAQAREGGWWRTPIVVLTGIDDDDLGRELLRAGAQDYLLKQELDGRTLMRSLRYAIDRKQTEIESARSDDRLRQAQKLESVGSLARGVAHEFNNILMVILGLAELMSQELEPEHPMRDDLQQIIKSGQRGATLTRQLLAFARTEMTQPRAIDLNEAIGETQQLLARLLGADVRVSVSPAHNLSPVHMDPGQLEQVLMNLCVNAREAMPRGGNLSIATRNVSLDAAQAEAMELQAGDYILLTVSDDGVGIMPDTLERIFDPFFTTKPHTGGSGLGLSMVYGIVKQNRGHIEVASQRGEGTTFRMWLPAHPEVPFHEAQHEASDIIEKDTRTVLLVEDEVAVRKLARRVLQNHGYRVLEAGDGREALAVVDSAGIDQIDMVVTDCVMPEMGGGELVERLRIQKPRLPVVLMSGYSETPTLRRMSEDDRVAFLRKPFTTSRLMGAVTSLLDS